MEQEYNFKSYADIEVTESPAETDYVMLVSEEGSLKKISAESINSNNTGGVMYITIPTQGGISNSGGEQELPGGGTKLLAVSGGSTSVVDPATQAEISTLYEQLVDSVITINETPEDTLKVLRHLVSGGIVYVVYSGGIVEMVVGYQTSETGLTLHVEGYSLYLPLAITSQSGGDNVM